MVGEIYITSAMGLFIAAFGWSDKLFGFSRRIIQAELSFCGRISMKYSNYKKLLKVLHTKYKNPGIYTKDIISLIRGTKLKPGSTEAFKKLKENYLVLKDWKSINEKKKVFFGFLFIFLFVFGTLILIIKNDPKIIILSQICLLLFIIIGLCIQKKLLNIEHKFENNINALFAHNEGN
ncbi:hypothetical protein KJ671_01005 [Patescibacteria group bacterium]|nr:hypothetical protein [Patescibacteria group bacterium]